MRVLPLIDETELLSRTAAGDQRAFRAIYERYYRKVYTQATRLMRSEELGEEILQEVFLKFWRLGNELTTIINLEGYLKVATRNQSLNALRRLALETKNYRALSDSYTDSHNETEEAILLKDTLELLNDAIRCLPKQQREVYQLCHQEGLKYEQAAERLNLSPLTVKTHMHRALKSLRSYLQDHNGAVAILIILKIF